MKKLLLFFFIIPFCSFAQLDTITKKVFIKNYAGIDIYGTYKLNNVKKNKKQYIINIEYINTTGKELFYKEIKGVTAGTVKIKGDNVNWFSIMGDKSTKKIDRNEIRILYPNKRYVYYDVKKWYNENEVPEFDIKINSGNTLENDYSKYN